MITDDTTILRHVGNTIYDIFVLPGDFLLSQFAGQAPAVASMLGLVGDDQSEVLPVVLSLLIWILLAVIAMKIFRLWQNILRIVTATIKAISFRISLTTCILRTALMRTVRRLIPRRSNKTYTTLDVEFDDLDLAVLRSAAACGPAFTTSAPELADQLKLRPGRIQRSLDKLSNNKMLDYVIGSTDGFETYRLSQSGAFYMAMWQRKERGS